MRRVAWVLVAVLLLAVPAVDAAAHGARPAIGVACSTNGTCTVTDVAIGSSTSAQCSTSVSPSPSAAPCRFAATNLDPTGRFTGGASAATWNIWNVDGSTRQSGSADPLACPSPPPEDLQEDCDSDALDIAISANGNRIAVASRPSMTTSLVQVYDDTGGRRASFLLESVLVNDIAIDAAGNRVAIASTHRQPDTVDPEDGIVHLFDVGSSTPTQLFATASGYLQSPATTVDLTAGVLTAGAGSQHVRFAVPSSTPFSNTGIQGTINDVDAAAGHSGAWTVAGYSSGFFAVFSNHMDSGNHQPSVPDYQKREAGETTAINDVAIRDDATMFAVGHEGGRLRLYSLDPNTAPSATVSLITEKSGLGGIDNLAFSSDGRYLAMRSDSNVRLFYTGNNGLDEMWSDTRSGLADSIAIDGRGEHVVVGVGQTVVVYDAIHKVTPILGSHSQLAGSEATYDVTYRNDGNRAESLGVAVQFPSGVDGGADPSSFTLMPGASRTVKVTVDLPVSQAPGNLDIPLRLDINGGSDGAPVTNLRLTVPTTHDLVLESVGPASKGANAGGPATFEVLARNDGNVQETVELSVLGLPSGWTADLSPSTLSLASGAEQNVTVALQPPASSARGTRADVVLHHDGVGGIGLPLTATVGAEFGVRLTAPVGTIIHPGVTALLNLTVRNDGNTLDSSVVKVNALPAGWLGGFLNGQAESDVADLEPGQSRQVQMTLRAPDDYSSSVPVQITAIANSLGDPAKTSTARVLVTVQTPSNSTTDSDTDGGGGGNGIPGPAPVAALMAIGLAALASRRRR